MDWIKSLFFTSKSGANIPVYRRNSSEGKIDCFAKGKISFLRNLEIRIMPTNYLVLQDKGKPVYVKIKHVMNRLPGWSKQEVKDTFSGRSFGFLEQTLELDRIASGEEVSPTSQGVVGEVLKIGKEEQGEGSDGIPSVQQITARKCLDLIKKRIGNSQMMIAGDRMFLFQPLHLQLEKRGTRIGEGTNSRVFETETGEAVKVAKFSSLILERQTSQVVREARILDVLHGAGEVEGIQKKLSLFPVEDIHEKGKSIEILSLNQHREGFLPEQVSLGKKYEGDLNLFLEKHSERNNKEEMFSMQKQLVNGLRRMHELDIVHGDINPKNIFFDRESGALKAYIGDWGDSAQIKPEDPEKLQLTFSYTPEYTIKKESKKFRKKAEELFNLQAGDEQSLRLKKECLDIRKKIDIFQMEVVLYQTAVGDRSALPVSPEGVFLIPESDLKEKLENIYGQGDPRPDCILAMLDPDPSKRPSAESVYELFSSETDSKKRS